ncbi:SoxR reducing system RseC family protein [Bacteroides helcogenes]|uniref:Positive regulator of sigma(E), RseC/MucC n=1 Tax=Bacteroides helcogenes (strain ATCC 35417 / DSM 20613 / JCM 6297 / CCUG 15421 / P 36-108) TaxID=693979 RepID=E6SVA0_BACT6|nr:SoxR reducing system RseC family protein [Bacteroides helcogenes]ADV44466.1 positive regulator of sigma(E), RseC/MucC [Bacteroides helcogenes P 36-108]MDY5237116.1 SoxR reducing system RseC family protein [Bacteroides helcogenes]
MANTIRHQGIVENINGSHLKVRIVQTSACASCSVKGHCTSADIKEKLIDVTDINAASYQVGDCVWIVGEHSMGVMAVLFAFIFPFFVLVVFLFIFMAVWDNELSSALCSLALLIPYYYILWLNKSRLGKKFSFSIQPMN